MVHHHHDDLQMLRPMMMNYLQPDLLDESTSTSKQNKKEMRMKSEILSLKLNLKITKCKMKLSFCIQSNKKKITHTRISTLLAFVYNILQKTPNMWWSVNEIIKRETKQKITLNAEKGQKTKTFKTGEINCPFTHSFYAHILIFFFFYFLPCTSYTR